VVAAGEDAWQRSKIGKTRGGIEANDSNVCHLVTASKSQFGVWDNLRWIGKGIGCRRTTSAKSQ
jgi:hypothetical protein